MLPGELAAAGTDGCSDELAALKRTVATPANSFVAPSVYVLETTENAALVGVHCLPWGSPGLGQHGQRGAQHVGHAGWHGTNCPLPALGSCPPAPALNAQRSHLQRAPPLQPSIYLTAEEGRILPPSPEAAAEAEAAAPGHNFTEDRNW